MLKCYDDKGEATKYLRALYANVHEGVSELSMYVVKANIKDGEMRLRMTSSDTGKDAYDESMSTELFDDFLAHIRDEDEIPEAFKSVIAEETWDGGMPYVSIAHYKSGKDGVNVPGVVKSIYRDGKVLKATAVLYDTPLGRAVFKSLQKDLVEKRDDKVRVSIGFLDLSHSHGDKYTFVRKALGDKCPLCKEGVGDKIYKKGHLVHLALTRVPANPRTDVEVEKSMTTKREDAESIIEDEEVVKGLDLKSQAEDVLVIKSDNPDDEQAEDKKKKKKDGKEEMQEESVAENTVVSNPQDTVTVVTTTANIPVGTTTISTSGFVQTEPTPVEKSFAVLKSKIEAIKSQGLVGEAALAAIQPDFDQIGEVIKTEFTPKPSPEAEAQKSLETTLRSLLNEMLPQILGQTVAPIQSQIETLQGELRAKSLTVPTKKEEIQTVQRSLTPTLVQKAAVDKLAKKSVSQFDLIAQQSVGLQ